MKKMNKSKDEQHKTFRKNETIIEKLEKENPMLALKDYHEEMTPSDKEIEEYKRRRQEKLLGVV